MKIKTIYESEFNRILSNVTTGISYLWVAAPASEEGKDNINDRVFPFLGEAKCANDAGELVRVDELLAASILERGTFKFYRPTSRNKLAPKNKAGYLDHILFQLYTGEEPINLPQTRRIVSPLPSETELFPEADFFDMMPWTLQGAGPFAIDGRLIVIYAPTDGQGSSRKAVGYTDYDEDFFRLLNAANSVSCGKKDEQVTIHYSNGDHFFLSNLVYLYHTGRISVDNLFGGDSPLGVQLSNIVKKELRDKELTIDHLTENKADNRICSLAPMSASANSALRCTRSTFPDPWQCISAFNPVDHTLRLWCHIKKQADAESCKVYGDPTDPNVAAAYVDAVNAFKEKCKSTMRPEETILPGESKTYQMLKSKSKEHNWLTRWTDIENEIQLHILNTGADQIWNLRHWDPAKSSLPTPAESAPCYPGTEGLQISEYRDSDNPGVSFAFIG